MATQTIAKKAPVSFSLNSQAVITASVAILTAATITATVLQSDIFMYLCGTLALMGVYALDRDNNKKGGDK